MKTKITLIIVAVFFFTSARSQDVGQTYAPVSGQSTYFDVSQPLTEVGVIPPKGASGHHLHKKGNEMPQLFKDAIFKNPDNALPKGDDPVWQKYTGSRGMSEPIQNFEGTRNSDNGPPGDYVAPPDTDGDVGPNHYFQMCNTIFQIFDKQGTSLFGPADNSTIWNGFVGDWTGTNDGDPIVLYDQQADRWLVSQFAINTDVTGGTYWVLVAISTTGNPTGSYYRYAFQFTSFPDYPKFGIWRDGYYLMVQHGNGSVTAAALNRSQMIAGNITAQMVTFNVPSLPGSGFIGMLPSDNDGTWAPSGAPNYFVYFSDDAWGDDPVDRLKIWEFDVNWTWTWLSTLTFTTNLNTAAFSSAFGSHNQGIIPQPGTTQGLAVIEKALMNRLQYRNFGSYESMVCCHTVDVNGANRAGMRWYELRKTTGAWYIYQQGTYAPGTTDNYWMGSIAQNGDGDIALGFSVSSGTRFPSIHYTGRNPNDPLGQMTMGEQVIFAGANAQNGTARWGDYTMMSVDPSDDETFWYTNQYLGNYNWWGAWITQIASFTMGDNCAASGGCDEYISRVQFGSIDNTSACSGYQNNTNLVNDIPNNTTETITVTNGNPYPSDQCGIWVDWNRDGDFSDANETIAVSGTSGVGPYTANISVPAGVTLGECILRIRITYSGAVSPCGATTFGEVEDYTINVAPPAPNVWTGGYNYYWHNAGNWSLGHIPTSDEDVIMTSAGYHPPSVSFFDDACKNLTIESGAGLNIAEKTLIVNGDLNISGNLAMNNSAGVLTVLGDVTWESGSTAAFTASTAFNVYGNWTFESGANANIAAGTVLFAGTADKYIRNYATTSSFFNVGSYKPAGYELGISNLSTQPLTINGYIYVHPAAQFGVYSNFDVVLKGNINSNGIFLCNYGTIKLDGVSQELRMNVDNYFNNLTFSQTGTVTVNNSLSSIVDVNGNVLIESGVFNLSDRTMKVGGNWTNSVGSSAFTEGTSRVIFDGTGHNYVKTSETFNIIEANMGAALRVDNASSVVTCNQYDWTSGGIDVVAGTFTAIDLYDNGIFGGYWLNPGGTINLTNDGWVDLAGNVNIYGGNFNVYGGTTDSYWPFSANASITMTGGVFDFKGVGIYIPGTSSYTFTENITGGIIRTVGSFNNQRTTFTPTGNTIEMYGNVDAYLTTGAGCSVDDVVVNKGAVDGMPPVPLFDREGKPIEQTRASTVFAGSSPLTILGNLTIEAGTFNLGAYTCTVAGITDIYGTLAMTNAANDLTSGTISWNTGSNDNVTAGTFHADEWKFNEGTNAKLGTGNTAYVYNLYYPTDSDAEFGNLEAVPYSKLVNDNTVKAYYPTRVAGNFTAQSGVNWYFQYEETDLIVSGNSTIANTASVEFNLGDFINTGSFTLNGSLFLGTNSIATIEGDFIFPATGTLNVGVGTFTNNFNTGMASLAGTLQLTTGTVEFPNRVVSLSTTFNDQISGGLLRCGRTLIATAAGVLQPTGGTVEFINASLGNYVQVTNGNYLFNMVLDKPGSSFLVYDNLVLKGSLFIDDGILNSNNKTISIAGDWMNNVGPAAFAETNSRVIFNKSGAQFCSTEDFYILEVDKPLELLYNVAYNNITCQIYDWTNGGLWISPGNFSAADLADDGLFGTFAIFGGTMDLYQGVDQFVDVNGNITIGSGGYLNVYGGNGESYWPWYSNASITMSGGVFDFKDVGIYVNSSSSYTFTENITGGTIKTSGNFQAGNPAFTPAGGTVELNGGTDAAISNVAGSNFHNLTINKSGGSDEGSGPLITHDRNGETIVLSRANQVTVYSDLLVNGNLTVNAGKLGMGDAGYSLTCMGSASIENSATLEMVALSKIKLNTSLTVKNGGTFRATGSAGSESWVTRAATNRYLFDVQSGANIGASYTIFEYMGANGISIASGAVVDPAQAFNNCTFRQGLTANTLLTINSTQTLDCTGAIFPANTWGGTNNVKKSVNSGRITFYDYSGAFAGPAYESDPYSRVDWFTPGLSASPLVLNVNPPAGTATINVTSNLAWTATESSPWFSISPLSGTNNGIITVTYNQNTSASGRSGTITISAPDVPNVIVTVNQAGATLTVTPASRSVTAPAGSTTFTVGSNTLWTVSESVSWFSVSPMSGTANGTLTVNYDQNVSTTPRSGQITVSSAGLPNVVVTVSQAGAGATLTVTPANRAVTPSAGSTTYSIASNTGWVVTESVAWFSVAPLSGTGNGTLTVNYNQNSTGSPRVGSILVTASGGSPVVTVTVSQSAYPGHAISLSAGWQGLSSYIMPTNNDIVDVFNPISGQLIIAATLAEMYYPAGPVNTIIDWESQSAYKVKMNAAASLTIIGNPETNKSFALPSGWSLVPVICNVPVEAVPLFAPTSLAILKDVAGTGVYWPEFAINTIGFLQPGQAYLAKLNSAATVVFPANAKEASGAEVKVHQFPEHPWNEVTVSPASHQIAILADGMQGLLAGDVLGVFDESGNCFGVTAIHATDQNQILTAYANDELTAAITGFADGNLMHFKVYRPQTNEILNVEVGFDTRLPQQQYFQAEGLSAISVLKVSAVGVAESTSESIGIYPNPTTGVVTLSGIAGYSNVHVIAASGNIVRNLSTDHAGQITIDLSAMSKGIYQLHFIGKELSVYKKLILN
ncbi:MAG: T9SS type A sorting domain-containing protein [Clostridia bacterium]|nr:T9SS type A sorting domain-containing protein [Clostridia bacterium]